MAALAIAGFVMTGSAARAESRAAGDRASLDAGVRAAQAGDCKAALRLISPVLKSPNALAENVRAAVDLVALGCALKINDTALAYGYSLDGTGLNDASDELWRMRLGLELDGKRHDAALTTVTLMTQGRGAALNAVPVRWLLALDNGLRDAGDTAGRRRLLAMLAEPSYVPIEPIPVADLIRRRYAEVLFDAGEKEAALGLVAQIETPSTVMAVSVDPRFRSAVRAGFDARKATAAFLDRLNDIAARHPDSLDVVIEIAAAQRLMGQPEAALATLHAGDPTVAGARPFADKDEKLNWWWDGVARSHAAAGHYEQAVAAMQQGMGLKEDGQPNVSQTINLAEAQLRYGHFDDALATLDVFQRQSLPASPYGEMEMRFARGCAAQRAGKGDPHGDVAFAKAHPGDHPQALSDLLLCIGDIDSAATAFIARLDDPARRVDALLELSEFDAPAGTVPADPVYGQLRALTARDDVKAAIARAGGARKFNVQRLDL
jgi:tetratricopeptide (TPR) repeat protein